MRVLVVTDAWRPQVNGVVRTLERLQLEAGRQGADIRFLAPDRFPTVPMPGYADIRLARAMPSAVAKAIENERPDAVHIATEGPLGLLARRWAIVSRRPFTTCYHTRYPQYISARYPVPENWTYAAMRWFHNAGATTMVATESLKAELSGRGFKNLAIWSRGVDGELFRPHEPRTRFAGQGPVFLCVGRVAVEKNLEAFLSTEMPGTKIVVGDGPDRERLSKRYPDAVFTGALFGQDLADAYAQADVFVFPSLTDTFGLVLLEALASGVPVAAFPGAGLVGQLGPAGVAVLDQDLGKAALGALTISRTACRDFALGFSHAHSTTQFLDIVRSVAVGVEGSGQAAAACAA
jgi:glycosyltransferase involved in cell wall biosynthesis